MLSILTHEFQLSDHVAVKALTDGSSNVDRRCLVLSNRLLVFHGSRLAVCARGKACDCSGSAGLRWVQDEISLSRPLQAGLVRCASWSGPCASHSSLVNPTLIRFSLNEKPRDLISATDAALQNHSPTLPVAPIRAKPRTGQSEKQQQNTSEFALHRLRPELSLCLSCTGGILRKSLPDSAYQEQKKGYFWPFETAVTAAKRQLDLKSR
eukprot:6190563-Pleurochrysis_carterae.AAC.5